ncbi:MAG TPA: hypothetical protein VGX78_23185 [Pirellulales bacterium]|nr:hypothetical protein [Pirellulales bacterium]
MSDQAATPTVRLGESVPDAATPKAIATPKSKSAAPVVRREAQPRDEAATVMLSDKATTQVAQSGTPGPVAAKAKVITTAKPKSGLPVVHREGQRSGHAAAVSDQVQVIATTMRPGGQRQDGAPEMVLVTDRSKAEKPASRLDAPKRSKPAANAATAAPSTHAGKHASTGDDLGPRQDAEELDSAKPASAWDTLKSKAGKLFTPRLAQ